VGIFAVAQRLSSLGTLFFLAIGNISTPIFADYYSRGEIAPLKKLYQTTTKWVVMFNVPLFLLLIFFTKPILSIFGGDFSQGSAGLVILAIGNLVYTGTGPGANLLDMTNHTKFNSANSAFLIIVTIVSDLLLIPRWGVIGAAAASAFSTVIVNMVCLIEVYILIKIQPYGRGMFKPILAGLIASAITYLLNSYMVLPALLNLLVGGTILLGIYALVLIMLGFSEEDLLVINNFRSQISSMKLFVKPIAESPSD
jgi:O-antigen/teichoic acid export membrane protein